MFSITVLLSFNERIIQKGGNHDETTPDSWDCRVWLVRLGYTIVGAGAGGTGNGRAVCELSAIL
jgi:hypothetical protein